jgi:DNA-binding XRE family transcriptional regulator
VPPEWLRAIQEAQEHTHSEPSGSLMKVVPSSHDPPGSNECDPEFDHASDLLSLLNRLKRARERKGLSQGEVARRTRQARSAISRLESGEYANPTLHTLYRYAQALGWSIRLCAAPMPEEPQDPACSPPQE